jgi:translation initiation factor 3 subunit C
MSRFFRGGDDSSSESSSDEEDLSLSEEEETTTKDQQSEDESSDDFDDDDDESEESSDDDDGDKPKGLSRFLLDQDSSESEEEDVEATTKVKSAKDKRHDELEATITGIQNGQKINDWHLIANGGCAKVSGAERNTDIGRRV